MSRKRISVVLVLSLLITLLAACGGSGGNSATENGVKNEPANTANSTNAPAVDVTDQYGDTGGIKLPIVDKPTTITWMLVSETPVNGKMIQKEIEKRTGITVDFQAYSGATYQEKLRVTVGSGKLPDIFHGLKTPELNEIGKLNGVVAINDYADMLPNFSRLYVEENPWVFSSYGDENGKIYSWPIYNMNRAVNHGMMYRKDIFEKNGIPEYTDTESFYQALKQLKEIYPDSYPWASKTKENIFKDLSYGWGIGGASYPAAYDEASGQWKFAPVQPEHKEMLDFFKKLYNEGLLDPEFLTDTSDSWTSKMTTDKSFVTFDWIGRLDLFYNQVKDSYPTYDLRYGNPIGPTGNNRSLPLIENFGIAVANNENKEVALKLLDYLTSPSGAELVTLGVEGETFNFDENGKPVYPELVDEPLVDINVLNDRYGLWLEGMYLAPDRRSVYYNYSEKEQEAQDKLLAENKFETLDPLLNFTDDENAKIAKLQTNLEKAANEFNAKYVLDKKYGDAQWDEWIKNAESIGVNEFIEVYNSAQARYDASTK